MQAVGKLADEPAIRDLVIEHDRITLAGGLANAAKASSRRTTILAGPRIGSAGRLIKDLVAFVHDLDVLGRTHFAVGIRRSTVTNDTRVRDAGKIEDGRRNASARVGRVMSFAQPWSGCFLVEPVPDSPVGRRFVFLHSLDRPRFDIAQRR